MKNDFQGITSKKFPIPKAMKAWVLGDPDQLSLVEKPIQMPGKAEVLLRIDAVAICATDLDVISHGPPAMIEGGLPFNKNFLVVFALLNPRSRFLSRQENSSS